MLPNFLIIGAQKAGTSWLAACLCEHHDVYIAEEKEIYFFNQYYDKELGWYESYFQGWSGQSAVGEATPGYIWDPHASSRIQSTLGPVKLIASLRHPVDRAYSAFWHHLSRGRIPVDADFRTWFQQDHHFGLYSRGNYFTQLQRYLQCFPQENLLVLIYEEMVKHPQQAIADCFEFLGVDTQFVPSQLETRVNKTRGVSRVPTRSLAFQRAKGLLPQQVRRHLAARWHQILERAPQKRQHVPLPKDLRQELLSAYMSEIRHLEHLLKRDLSLWYQPSDA
jgi:hypothetical protein